MLSPIERPPARRVESRSRDDVNLPSGRAWLKAGPPNPGLGLITPPVWVGVYTAAAILGTPPQQAFRYVPGFFAVGIVYAAM